MLSICQAILNESSKEVEANADMAIKTYQQCKLPQFSTRTILIYYEYLKVKSLYREASATLLRATSEVCFYYYYSLIIIFLFRNGCQYEITNPRTRI